VDTVDRRSFLVAIVAAATRVRSATARARAATSRPETFTQWISASRKARADALQPCLDFIRGKDASIHAWVQVQPERPTGDGKLSDIPFGAKDIIETNGLATEYGSPIWFERVCGFRRRGTTSRCDTSVSADPRSPNCTRRRRSFSSPRRRARLRRAWRRPAIFVFALPR